MEKQMATFLSTMLNSATNAHFFHWSTDSFSKHMALGTYYDEIVDLTDALAEAYFGCYGKITVFPNTSHTPTDPLKYMESLQSFVKEARADLPQESQFVQLIDNIAELLDTTVYKLKFLK